MRARSFIPLSLRESLGTPSRLLSLIIEVGLVGWVVVLLETLGPRTARHGSDLVGFLLGGVLAMVLVAVARAGYLPWTRRALGGLRRAAMAVGRRLAPPTGVAFRLPADPAPVEEHACRAPTFVLLVLAIAALFSGGAVPFALTWVKVHVSYTLYVLGLTVLWALFGAVTIVALLAARAAVARARAPFLRTLPLLAWLTAIILAAWSPGWVLVALFLVALLLLGPTVLQRPAGRYFLYRRLPGGGFGAVTVDGYLRSAFLFVSAFLGLTCALAQAPRLWTTVVPSGTYALTLALGLSASIGAVYLVVRAGLHMRKLYGRADRQPEVPLVPTLWWPGGDSGAAWVEPARHRGWRITFASEPPPRGFDLVAGIGSDPRAFRPDNDLSVDDALFRLDRRFHVVMRRAFHRRFQALYKAILAVPRPAGSGYLFCPFAWPVRGVVRDTGGVDPDDPDGRQLGGALVGRPYDAVFPPRLRRYLHGIFRDLDLDVLYWEERVVWRDLRQVTGVLFETWDQGRRPALDRHFVGIARIRVVIQEPEDGDETGPQGVAPADVADTPLPLRARVLVVRRDDGGQEIEAPDQAPATRQPEPMLI